MYMKKQKLWTHTAASIFKKASNQIPSFESRDLGKYVVYIKNNRTILTSSQLQEKEKERKKCNKKGIFALSSSSYLTYI